MIAAATIAEGGGAVLDHATVVAGCAAGDAGALRTLFEAEAPRLIAVAQRILRRRDLAEEAVQDAFVAIWRKAASYDPARGSARGWIYAIVRKRALTMLRDGAREDLADADALDALRDATDAVDSAAEAFERLDDASRLRRCLAALDETKRAPILLAYVEGLTQGEIAGRLGAPLGTVKAWMRRGLAALRECMG
jgi:RNA polymerase sigma-70 factor (ECF subfamily)